MLREKILFMCATNKPEETQQQASTRCSLLSLDTESLTASTGGLGALTSDLVAPEVSETSVLLGLSHSLEILTHGGIHVVGNELSPVALSGVLLSVEEPLGDVVVNGTGNNVRDLLNVLIGELTSSLVAVDTGDLEGKDRESATNTSDLSEAEGSLLLTVEVSVLHTEDMLEVVHVLEYQGRHLVCVCSAFTQRAVFYLIMII